MFHHRATRAGLAVFTAAVFLVGCTSVPEPPKPEVLSASTAGGEYLTAVCPVNEAWDQADAALEQLRIAVSRGEGDPEQVVTALQGVIRANERAEKQLDAQRVSWPKPARSAVADVRDSLAADRKQAKRVMQLDADELAEYRWSGADAAGAAAVAAREALGILDDPEVACTQWAEQAATPDKNTTKKPEAPATGVPGKQPSAEPSPEPSSKPGTTPTRTSAPTQKDSSD